MGTDEATRADVLWRVANKPTEFEKLRDAWVKMIGSDEQRRINDAFAADWKAYLQVHHKVLALSRRNEKEEDWKLRFSESTSLYDSAAGHRLRDVDLNHRGALKEGPNSDRFGAAARTAMFAVAAAALTLAVVLALLVTCSIVRPLGGQPEQPQDRRHHRRDRRHRVPDPHPGVERRGGSGACRRTGTRLPSGGGLGARAQRSAEAAKEINSLIRRSFEQVGDAVGQMDQVMQQNAALVEESDAAAESLKAPARQPSDQLAMACVPVRWMQVAAALGIAPFDDVGNGQHGPPRPVFRRDGRPDSRA